MLLGAGVLYFMDYNVIMDLPVLKCD